MKVTCNWLKEYVDCSWDWPELVERLTLSGTELEGADDLGARFAGIVVGHVLECGRHPGADRLSVCRVDAGDEVRTVVCGAPNVAAGQKVALALPGARLPGGMEIRPAKIRGVESSGMICAEDELGLGEDHAGILVLDPALEPGQPLAVALGLDDVALDFEVTPNRPDCLSVLGIAREVRALNGASLRLPPSVVDEDGAAAGTSISVRVETPADCPRYVARVVRGVRIGPSPGWLQRRLRAVGLRPINNVVDVTNYVLMELGQPLHAFDLARLTDASIVVRRARPGESLETLDGVSRELTEEILVIADGRRPVAVAGVMGGAASEVTEQTTDLLLESACFEPRRVRCGRSLLQMQTEASMRFERGVDREMTPLAADRAARLIAELAGGKVAPGAVDVAAEPPTPVLVHARVSRVNQILSTRHTAAAITRVLELLGCRVTVQGDLLEVAVPSFRPDLRREADLIEEVGRIQGYDGIPGSSQARAPWLRPLERPFALRRTLREHLAGLGFDEAMTNTVVESRWLRLIDEEAAAVRLTNPPTEGQACLRTSLIPSLLDVARRNLNQRLDAVRVFELGRCFRQAPSQERPGEELRLAALWTGRRSASPWQADRQEADLLDLKGALEALLEDPSLAFAAEEHPCLRRGRAARIELAGEACGYLGEAAPTLCAGFDIDRPVYIFELRFQSLLEHWQTQVPTAVPLPRFPAIARDLALVLSEDTAAARVAVEIRAACPDLIEEVELFDLYQGDQIPDGHKSLAFALRFRAPDRTLADEEADAAVREVLERLKERCGAVLR
ncbi:MAG: phenylalanine--tRNA ligase subunit beta [Candidatus Latescibacterota bacterium]|jgi:phenylalanyl-tRNA synthetase beta chain